MFLIRTGALASTFCESLSFSLFVGLRNGSEAFEKDAEALRNGSEAFANDSKTLRNFVQDVSNASELVKKLCRGPKKRFTGLQHRASHKYETITLTRAQRGGSLPASHWGDLPAPGEINLPH